MSGLSIRLAAVTLASLAAAGLTGVFLSGVRGTAVDAEGAKSEVRRLALCFGSELDAKFLSEPDGRDNEFWIVNARLSNGDAVQAHVRKRDGIVSMYTNSTRRSVENHKPISDRKVLQSEADARRASDAILRRLGLQEHLQYGGSTFRMNGGNEGGTAGKVFATYHETKKGYWLIDRAEGVQIELAPEDGAVVMFWHWVNSWSPGDSTVKLTKDEAWAKYGAPSVVVKSTQLGWVVPAGQRTSVLCYGYEYALEEGGGKIFLDAKTGAKVASSEG